MQCDYVFDEADEALYKLPRPPRIRPSALEFFIAVGSNFGVGPLVAGVPARTGGQLQSKGRDP